MADESHRKYRPADRAWPGDAPASGREGAPDPLVELARLIGQNDPFAFDTGRGASRREREDPRPAERAAYPDDPPYDSRRPAERSYPDDNPRYDSRQPDPYDPRRNYQPDPYAAGGRWPGDDAGQRHDDRGYAAPQAAPRHPDEGAYSDEAGYRPAYPPGGYDQSAAYEDERGYDRAYQAGDDDGYAEDRYEQDEPPRSRRRLLAVAAVLALAVIGTAGAFGYRSMTGGSAKAPPPVIKADNAPNKVASVSQAGDNANKQIYERLGERGQGEKVVPREEQPVDIRDAAPRTLVPAMAPTDAAPTAPAAARPGNPATEPKKIRTVTIRPDQPSPDGATAARPAPAPAPRAAAPAAAQRGAATQAVPARPVGNAPLSLNPGGEPAPTPEPPRTVPARTALAAPPPRAAEAGNFVVQLSAQKSESEAQASFRAMQAKYPSVLSGRQPLIRKKDLGAKGIYYGAQVGPFASREQAVQLCEDLKTAGGSCIVQRN